MSPSDNKCVDCRFLPPMSNSSFLALSSPPITFHSFHQQSTISPPLSPLVSPFTTISTTAPPAAALPSPSTFPTSAPPAAPLPWVWQCHVCKARWPLGATRRCLIDGHYYCSGQPQTRKGKPKAKGKRGRGCSSEFDYIGWKDWGRWRRAARGRELEGCGETCDFPSHCRYRKAGVGGPKAAVDEVLKETKDGENDGQRVETAKIKSLEEILEEAEVAEDVNQKKEKKEKRLKTKKAKLTPVLETIPVSSSAKPSERAKEKERGLRRSQSISLAPSSERLHKLKEAAARRIERSKSDNTEHHPHREKERGLERRNADIAVEPRLQPFLLPVLDFISRKVPGETLEDRAPV